MEDFPFIYFRHGYRHSFWTTTGAYGYNNSIEAAIRRVINDPTILRTLKDGLNPEIEPRVVLQVVMSPELGYLSNDLLSTGVAIFPSHERMKAI